MKTEKDAEGNIVSIIYKGRMLPHTGLFLLWKVALQMRIRRL